MIRWEQGKRYEDDVELSWHGFLGDVFWCEFIEPYEDEHEKEEGYVYGLAIDGHICDATTLEEAKEGAEAFTFHWLASANLTVKNDELIGMLINLRNINSFPASEIAPLYRKVDLYLKKHSKEGTP